LLIILGPTSDHRHQIPEASVILYLVSFSRLLSSSLILWPTSFSWWFYFGLFTTMEALEKNLSHIW